MRALLGPRKVPASSSVRPLRAPEAFRSLPLVRDVAAICPRRAIRMLASRRHSGPNRVRSQVRWLAQDGGCNGRAHGTFGLALRRSK